MATNHTENYNLNLWEPTDKFIREEFNQNTTRLEAALVKHDGQIANLSSTKADQTALNALSQTVAGKANQSALSTLSQTVNQKARIAVGYYTGNDAEARSVNVGFTPQAVLVMDTTGRTYHTMNSSAIWGGLAVAGSSMISDGAEPALKIVSGGFQVATSTKDRFISTNRSGTTYNYIALG